VGHSLTMRILLITILTLLSLQLFSQANKAKSFKDRDDVLVTIADTALCSSPLTYEFFENNIYGKLIMPELDLKTMLYEFIVTDIRTIKTNREFELSIYRKIDPKADLKLKALGGYGKSIYKLTIKIVDSKVKVDTLVYLYSEI
jgi:hypothetical protein